MLLPKQIVSLGKIAAREDSRYTLSAVRIERRDGLPRVMATDGRRAIIFSWEEPDVSDFPLIDGMDRQPIQDFGANVPPKVLADVGRGIPSRTAKPILGFVLLDESNRQTVHLAATTLDKVTRAEATAKEGSFPPIDDVIPQPVRAGTIYDRDRHSDTPFTHVRIAVNAKLLAETLAVISDLAAEDQNHTVVLTVPVNGASAIRADGRCQDRRAIAAIMPVSADFSSYDTEPEAPAAAVAAPAPAEPVMVAA